jgi:subtilisin family serine protease
MSLLTVPRAAVSLPRRTARTASRLAPLLGLVAALFVFVPVLPSAGAAKPTAAAEPQWQIARLGVDAWQKAGYRGKGVKVLVLDTGFRGYRDQLGKALPEHVTACSFRTDGNLEARDSQHGILCGEVIHTLAPDAELLLANWDVDDPATFLDAVRWARKEGVKLISTSVITPSWSDGEGGGKVHEALTRLLGAGDGAADALCFASAGNIAQRHWSGTFHDGGDGFHEWQVRHCDNEITPWGDERVSVELVCGPGSAYDLDVYDVETGRAVGRSPAADRKDKGCAVVHFQPEGRHKYRVRVRLAEGKGGSFHLSSLSAGLECSTAPGSVPFPGDGAEVLAVGAVDADGRRMGYSSCGPNSSQPKPDFVAPVPFQSHFRTAPFGGTSCAAPEAAAAAALCWSRYPDWTADRVRVALRASAQDLGPPGHDTETGYGLIHLPPATDDLGRLAREKDPAVKKPG